MLRRRSPKQIEEQLGGAVDELANALQRFLEGQRSAARTIAVNLRLMLNPRRGDQLLRRVAEAKGIGIAPVWQSQGPQFDQPGGPVPGELVMVFGPSFYDTADDAPPGSVEVPLEDALAGPCLTVKSAEGGLTLSWLETIVTVANKLAVHADEIPALLDQLDGLIVHNGQNAGFEQVLRKVAQVVVPRGQAIRGEP